MAEDLLETTAESCALLGRLNCLVGGVVKKESRGRKGLARVR